MKPQAVPSFAEVAAEPSRATGLPPDALTLLIARATGLQAALTMELATSLANHHEPEPEQPTRWITVTAAAEIAGVSPRFFYARIGRLRFLKKLSPKNVRVDEAGLRAWLASR
jgi:hypothetical protein